MKKHTISVVAVSLLILAFSCQSEQRQSVSDRGARETASLALVHPEWSKNATIYEVNVRQYTAEGTFEAFGEHLVRLKGMGVDILWLMPIHPIGRVNRKGELGSYYSVQDYRGVNAEYGTMDDFRALIGRVHGLDMRLIIDWVPNHTAWDHPWVEQHPGWYTKDDQGEFIPPLGTDWTDVIQLDFENVEMRQGMIDAMSFWVRDLDVDGFRCDVAWNIPTDFWEDTRSQLDSIRPVFMLAEAEIPGQHRAGFDMSYAWKLHHVMNEIAAGRRPVTALDTYFLVESRLFNTGDYRMHFTSNHDENSWNGTEYERLADSAAAFAVFAATVPGMPLVYSGQEEPLRRRLKFFERDPIEWGQFGLEKFYTTLFELKHENEALWNGEFGGDFLRLDNSMPGSVFSFLRVKGKAEVFVVINLSRDPVKVSVQIENYGGEYRDVFGGSKSILQPDAEILLPSWGYKVFARQ